MPTVEGIRMDSFQPLPSEEIERAVSNWRGDLTIGQHAFMWTSADYGDAYLAGTKDCASVEEATTRLKADVSSLCAAFLGEPLSRQARLDDGGIPPTSGPE